MCSSGGGARPRSPAGAERDCGKRMERTSQGSAPGSFGELLQGRDALTGDDFLVTNPIRLQARARFEPRVDGPFTVAPAHKLKSRRFAEALMAGAGARLGGQLTIDSDIPEGKGMASSSADLVATYRAMASALPALRLDEAGLACAMCAVEPSDAVMYAEHVAFAHRRGRLLRRLGPALRLEIVALDEGGTVDSVEFNGERRRFSRREMDEYGRLLERLAAAIAARDLAAVGAVATRSAVMWQSRNPKRLLAALRRIAARLRAPGIVVAHSGTVIGVLVDPDSPPQARDRVRRAVGEYGEPRIYRTLGAPA